MAYQTYTTEGFICGSYPRNTSDKYYFIFTRDAGMVVASARSVRDEKSKLRYGLQDFSYADVSLVRGRHDWRIVGVEPIENLYFKAEDRKTRAAVFNITMLLRRFVRGEDVHERLFDRIRSGFALLRNEVCAPELVERLVTLLVLNELGYVASNESLKPLLDTDDFYAAYQYMEEDTNVQNAVDVAIQHAFEVSQL